MVSNKELRKIVLIVTQNCNLNCTYCYEHYKSPKCMTFPLAKKIIDNEISTYSSKFNLTIEFFGGEPFLNFDLIKQIVSYTQSTYPDAKITFCATTNGTILTEDIRNWIKLHHDIFECSLSLDGTEYMHNLNRPCKDGKGSFSCIDHSFFLNIYPNMRAKMTVSKETLPMMSKGVTFLEDLGFTPVVDMAACEDYWHDDNIPILEQQLFNLVKHYSSHPDRKVCRMIDYDLRRIFIEQNEPFQYCGAGRNMITYDVDGVWYPCMALAPISQGKDSTQFKNEDFYSFKLSSNNKCRQCAFLRLCRSCYATNFNQSGNLENQTKIQCKINRLTLLASARIQFNRLVAKHKTSPLDKNETLILNAIWKIQLLYNDTEMFL